MYLFRFSSSRFCYSILIISGILLICVLLVFSMVDCKYLDHLIPVNLVYYGEHSTKVSSRIIDLKPKYLITNTPNGLWHYRTGNGVNVDLSEYQIAGIKIIGYITAGYEGRKSGGNLEKEWYSLERNLQLIKNMAEIDHVDGVFIDECSSYPDQDSRMYLKELTDSAHEYGIITWGNTGAADFDQWYFEDGGFDYMQSNEDWHNQQLSQVQSIWRSRISVTGIGPDLTAQQAFQITVDTWRQGIEFCYITNEYVTLPVWFDDYSALLRKYYSN
jgi:hypothetical protein